MKLVSAVFTVLFACLAGIPEASAQDETWRKDRFMVGVGMYRPNVETRIRVDEATTGISGTLLNLEDDLDLSDRKTEVTLDAHFRFAKRHALEFEYVNLGRTAETAVRFEIEYDGKVFGINEEVETTFETEVARLAYRFSFLNNARTELSAAIGLHVTDLKAGVNLVGQEQDFNEITAPLPTLGAAWKYHFNDQLTFHIRGEWLDIKVDNINGQLFAGLAELTWYPWRNFGGSLGYHIWDVSVSATKESLTGELDYTYDGPKLTLKARF